MTEKAGTDLPGEDSLFLRFGAETGLSRILDLQFERLLADDYLSEYFMDGDIPRLKTTLLAFLRRAFGDMDAVYSGPSLQVAHKGQLVTEHAFEAFIDIFIAAAKELGIDPASQTAARAVMQAMRASVITEFKPNPAYNYPTKPL
jgi:truncated hemoglobin YjbI